VDVPNGKYSNLTMTNFYIFLLLIVIFSMCFIVTFVSISKIYPSILDKRIQSLSAKPITVGALHDINNPFSNATKRWVRPFSSESMDEKKWLSSLLRTRFKNAGLHGISTVYYYLAAKTLLFFSLPLIAVFLGLILNLTGNWLLIAALLFICAATGYYLPNLVLSRIIKQRQQELFLTFPDALDLLRVCVEAGLGLDAAIERVGREMKIESKALAQEFTLLGLELRVGSTRIDALKNLAIRVGLDDITSLVSMLVQADKFGTSMADTLKIYANSLRDKRQNITEESAAKLPVKILLPLIFCVFPALLTVLMGPAAINIYQVLGSRIIVN
jgi:tight adherence protein C